MCQGRLPTGLDDQRGSRRINSRCHSRICSWSAVTGLLAADVVLVSIGVALLSMDVRRVAQDWFQEGAKG